MRSVTARKSAAKQSTRTSAKHRALLTQLTELERTGGDATVAIEKGVTLHLSSLDKVLFPKAGITKGDVMRYYVAMAPYLLPLVKDRPLSLKRFPEGVSGEFFFQQKAPSHTPPGVRVETIENDRGELQERLIGGSLATLLYCVQIGAFEINPWNVRVGSLDSPDYAVIDLDPGKRTPFSRVVGTARWVKEVLDEAGLHGAVKTSGATGLHIFVPLPTGSTEDSVELVAAWIARRVVKAHPKETTIERSLKLRGDTKVYVDAGQNAIGKTVAAAYSVRATAVASVSTPLDWSELTPSLKPAALTIDTTMQRMARLGDLWQPVLRRRNSVRSVTKA
jgi:bifunctional non-homologous end joining protein LigD